MTEDPRTRIRVHIGNISPKLRESGPVFQDRLARFGKVLAPLDFHTKPIGDFHFAFVDMELSQAEYKKLKGAFNGMLYMGRKLTLDVAKQPFEQAWAKDHGRPNPPVQEAAQRRGVAAARDLRIRESQTTTVRNSVTGSPVVKGAIGAHNATGYMKSAHTYKDMSGNTKHKCPAQSLVGSKSYGSSLVPRGPARQEYSRISGGGEVFPGRERRTPRPAAHFIRKEQTMRILVNGDLKQFKCYKTKLWGVEKKSVSDLTFSFHNGAWTSGDGHVVERLVRAAPAVSCGIDGDQATAYGAGAREAEALPVESFDQEKDKSAAVLAKLFQGHDFDKKIELEDEDVLEEDKVVYDSKGRRVVERYDYEAEGGLDEESDEELETAQLDVIEQYKNSAERPQDEVYYSESDEGNELDMDALHQYSTEAIKNKYDEEHGREEDTEEPQETAAVTEARPETPRLEDPEEVEVEKPEEAEQTEQVDTPEIREEPEVESTHVQETLNMEPQAEAKEAAESSESSTSQESSDDSSEEESQEEHQSEQAPESQDAKETQKTQDDSSSASGSEDSSADSDSDSDSDSSSGSDSGSDSTSSSDFEESSTESSDEESEPIAGEEAVKTGTETTENLRSLFNQEASSGFGFAIDEDDIDVEAEQQQEQERQQLLRQIKEKQEQETQSVYASKHTGQKFGLFWSHFESAFMQTQTQLSKIGYVGENVRLPGEDEEALKENDEGEEDAYERWFWSVRGEYGRECKRRKRDVLRSMKKKKTRTAV